MFRQFYRLAAWRRAKVARNRATLASFCSRWYKKNLIHTTDIERVAKSAFLWQCVERNGTVIIRKYYPLRWRIGWKIAVYFGLDYRRHFRRETQNVDQDRWGLSLFGICHGMHVGLQQAYQAHEVRTPWKDRDGKDHVLVTTKRDELDITNMVEKIHGRHLKFETPGENARPSAPGGSISVYSHQDSPKLKAAMKRKGNKMTEEEVFAIFA